MSDDDTRPRADPLLPRWMAPPLLTAAALGVLAQLQVAWVSFLAGSPYGDESSQRDTHVRFVDRAQAWVSMGAGSQYGWATLATLTAVALVVVSRRGHPRPVPDPLRSGAAAGTAAFALLELSGPLCLVFGYVQMSRDPTAARSAWQERTYYGPPAALCLVLALLAGVVAWVLVQARPTPLRSSTAEAAEPAERQRAGHGEAADPEALFRRPVR